MGLRAQTTGGLTEALKTKSFTAQLCSRILFIWDDDQSLGVGSRGNNHGLSQTVSHPPLFN